MQKFQVAYIGLNTLFGKASSLLLKHCPSIKCLKLYDDKNIGPALDVADICTNCKVKAFLGKDQLNNALNGADIVIIGDETNELETNAEKAFIDAAGKVIKYANAIATSAPKAIIILAASPLNSLFPVLTQALMDTGIYKSNKVLGCTAADTISAKCILANHLKVDPKQVVVPVIGGSSDESRVPLLSHAKPDFTLSEEMIYKIMEDIKNRTKYIQEAKGMCEAINKAYANLKFLGSIFAGLRGEKNITDIAMSKTDVVSGVEYFSLPVVLGMNGVCDRYKIPKLTTYEELMLATAIHSLKKDVNKANLYLEGKPSIFKQSSAFIYKNEEIFNLEGSKMSIIKTPINIINPMRNLKENNKNLSDLHEFSIIDLLSSVKKSQSELKSKKPILDNLPPLDSKSKEVKKKEQSKNNSHITEESDLFHNNQSLKDIMRFKFLEKRSNSSHPFNIVEKKNVSKPNRVKLEHLETRWHHLTNKHTSASELIYRFRNRPKVNEKTNLKKSAVTDEKDLNKNLRSNFQGLHSYNHQLHAFTSSNSRKLQDSPSFVASLNATFSSSTSDKKINEIKNNISSSMQISSEENSVISKKTIEIQNDKDSTPKTSLKSENQANNLEQTEIGKSAKVFQEKENSEKKVQKDDTSKMKEMKDSAHEKKEMKDNTNERKEEMKDNANEKKEMKDNTNERKEEVKDNANEKKEMKDNANERKEEMKDNKSESKEMKDNKCEKKEMKDNKSEKKEMKDNISEMKDNTSENNKTRSKDLKSEVYYYSGFAGKQNYADKRNKEEKAHEIECSERISLIKETKTDNDKLSEKVLNKNDVIKFSNFKTQINIRRPNILKKEGVISDNDLPHTSLPKKRNIPHAAENREQKGKYLIKQNEELLADINDKVLNLDKSIRAETLKNYNEAKLRRMDVVLNINSSRNVESKNNSVGPDELSPSFLSDSNYPLSFSNDTKQKLRKSTAVNEKGGEHDIKKDELGAKKSELRLLDVLLGANKNHTLESGKKVLRKNNIIRKLSLLNYAQRFDYGKILYKTNEEVEKLLNETFSGKSQQTPENETKFKTCSKNFQSASKKSIGNENIIEDDSQREIQKLSKPNKFHVSNSIQSKDENLISFEQKVNLSTENNSENVIKNEFLRNKLSNSNKAHSFSSSMTHKDENLISDEQKLNSSIENNSENVIKIESPENIKKVSMPKKFLSLCSSRQFSKEENEKSSKTNSDSVEIVEVDKVNEISPEYKKINSLDTVNTPLEKDTSTNKFGTALESNLCKSTEVKGNLKSSFTTIEAQPIIKKFRRSSFSKFSACQKCVNLKIMEHKFQISGSDHDKEFIGNDVVTFVKKSKKPSITFPIDTKQKDVYTEKKVNSVKPSVDMTLKVNINNKPLKSYFRTKFQLLNAQNSQSLVKSGNWRVKYDYRKAEQKKDLSPSESFNETKEAFFENKSSTENTDKQESLPIENSVEKVKKPDQKYDKHWFLGKNAYKYFKMRKESGNKLAPKKNIALPTLYQNLSLRKSFLKNVIEKYKSASKVGTKIQYRKSKGRKQVKARMLTDMCAGSSTDIPLKTNTIQNAALTETLNATNVFKDTLDEKGNFNLRVNLNSTPLSSKNYGVKRSINLTVNKLQGQFIFDNSPLSEYHKENNFPSVRNFF